MCLHIFTDTESKLAYIQNISYYPDCVSVGLERPGGGGKLLRMCIQFLKDNKKKYNVKRIQLKDNSFYMCQQNGNKINFALMHTLLYGDTWYGRYGFRPYDHRNDIRDEKLTKKYETNKITITTTKTSDTNLYNLIFRVLKEKGSENEKNIRQKIDEYYAKHHDKTLDVFFRDFLMDIDNACAIFSAFYVDFCAGLNIHNFSKKWSIQ
jgi:hypothetical protein